MHSGHTQHLGRLLARLSAGVLVSASIGFGAPALAAQPDSPGRSATAHTHQSAHHTPTASHHSHPATAPGDGGGSGGSGVSIPKPNGFQAQADPDGMANGGVDQPGGTGGVDTTSQDGNNGSGNDADCEDDNNGVGVPGHCKHPSEPVPPVSDTPTTTDQPTTTSTSGQDVAAPIQPQQPMTTTSSTQVQAPSLFAPGTGAPASRAATAAGVLPNTGASQGLLGLALAALVALGVGSALVRQGRRGHARA